MKMINSSLLLSAVFVFSSPNLASACDDGGGGTTEPIVFEANFTRSNGPSKMDSAVLELSGLNTVKFAGNHSCGVVASLPANVNVTQVQVLNSETGEDSVFEAFVMNPAVTRDFCTDLTRRCVAYVAKPKKESFGQVHPVKIRISLTVEPANWGGSTMAVATDIARLGSITTTGLDSDLKPIHHMNIHVPSKVTVKLGH